MKFIKEIIWVLWTAQHHNKSCEWYCTCFTEEKQKSSVVAEILEIKLTVSSTDTVDTEVAWQQGPLSEHNGEATVSLSTLFS